jgi:hypothetical protein
MLRDRPLVCEEFQESLSPPEVAGRPRATPRRPRRPANQPKGLGKTTVAEPRPIAGASGLPLIIPRAQDPVRHSRRAGQTLRRGRTVSRTSADTNHATWRSFEMVHGRTELGRPPDSPLACCRTTTQPSGASCSVGSGIDQSEPAGSCPAPTFVDYRAAVAPNSSYRIADN